MKTFKQIFESSLNLDEAGFTVEFNNLKTNKRVRKTFKDQKAFTKWMDKNEGDVNDLNFLRESSGSSSLECMECGHKFKKKIGKGEVKCPKCKSVDVEVE
ncbi:MAG: hypothetical protein DRP51_10335 [Candidatus Zixiibacteriota bacterium]|nr:MAG: hypothetical protein DRP51_10335 [candidate division Zixibacteria bacterium]